MIHRFHPSQIDSIADAMIRAICGAEAEEMIRHKLTLALSPSGERKPVRIAHAAYFDAEFKRLGPYERRWKSMLRTLWADEQAIILANLKKLKKAQLGKGVSDNIMYPQMPFKNRLSKETKKLLTVMLADIGQDKLDELNLGKSVKDLGIAFDVTNPHIKKWIEDYVFKFSENLETINTQKLRAILDAGFEEGKSIPEIMKDINGLFDSWNTYRAEIISRTETSRASNQAAVEAYRQSGVVEQKQWLTAPGCCDICAEIDGDVVALEEAFFDDDYGDGMSPPKHPNCVLPGTLCETPGGIVAGIRAWYRGQAIQLTFANGRCLSVTPNHMFLTPNGFAPAHLLRQGDDVFYCPDAKGVVAGDPNNDRKPTLIEEMVGSLSESGGMMTRRVPLAPEYLHGDGRFCDGDIDVIGPYGLLHDTDETSATQVIGTPGLDRGDARLSNLPGSGDLASMFERLADTADGIMGGLRQASPFFLARLGHAHEHRGTTPARINPVVEQSSSDDTSGNTEVIGQKFFRPSREIHLTDQLIGYGSSAQKIGTFVPGTRLNSGLQQAATDCFMMGMNSFGDTGIGQTRLIETTKVIDVKVFPYSGHVYDLQTITSLYICNSIVSSNCRCSVVAFIE